MAEPRQLPDKRNVLLDEVPPYSELVARRRLGQTQLTPRIVPTRMVAGASVAMNPATLPAFDYVHLRAPLPRNIVSGIFKSGSPSSYFLMRRASDGYVSATGMFKATFPWARYEEEEAERKYLKSMPSTSKEETAGNVWIPPEEALDLADEYGILPWIYALLDPADVMQPGPTDAGPPKEYRSPPKFFGGKYDHPTSPQPRSTRSSGRIFQSVSPSKPTVSRRSLASLRKPRQLFQPSTVDSPPGSANGSFTSAIITSESTLVDGEGPGLSPSSTQATKIELVENEVKFKSIEEDLDADEEEDPKLKVHFEEDVETDEDGVEVEHIEGKNEVHLFAPMPDPEDAMRDLQAAREAVEASKQAVAASEDDESVENEMSASKDVPSPKNASVRKKVPASKSALAKPASKKSKRKADEIAKGDNKDGKDGEVAENDEAEHQSKKAKTEVDVRKEGMKKRAIYGIAGTIAMGALAALAPYVLG